MRRLMLAALGVAAPTALRAQGPAPAGTFMGAAQSWILSGPCAYGVVGTDGGSPLREVRGEQFCARGYATLGRLVADTAYALYLDLLRVPSADVVRAGTPFFFDALDTYVHFDSRAAGCDPTYHVGSDFGFPGGARTTGFFRPAFCEGVPGFDPSALVLQGVSYVAVGHVADLPADPAYGMTELTATAVPEPSALALVGLGTAALALGAASRRRA